MYSLFRTAYISVAVVVDVFCILLKQTVNAFHFSHKMSLKCKTFPLFSLCFLVMLTGKVVAVLVFRLVWLEKKSLTHFWTGLLYYQYNFIDILQELFEFGMLTGQGSTFISSEMPAQKCHDYFFSQQTLVMFSKVRRLH